LSKAQNVAEGVQSLGNRFDAKRWRRISMHEFLFNLGASTNTTLHDTRPSACVQKSRLLRLLQTGATGARS